MSIEQPELWQRRVWENLVLGFGVEDIAIKTGASIEHVRAEVRILRDEGRLESLYRHARNGWRNRWFDA